MTGYRLTDTAEEELRGILQFIAQQDGIARALHVHDKFLQIFEGIAAAPGIGFRRPHLTGDTLRWHPVFRFLILYEPDTSPLTILRILHGARDLDRIFQKEQ